MVSSMTSRSFSLGIAIETNTFLSIYMHNLWKYKSSSKLIDLSLLVILRYDIFCIFYDICNFVSSRWTILKNFRWTYGFGTNIVILDVDKLFLYENLSWKYVNRLTENMKITIMPTAASERHKPHLPLSINAIDGYNIANQKHSNNTAIATAKKEGTSWKWSLLTK